jgi:hypothetical protein
MALGQHLDSDYDEALHRSTAAWHLAANIFYTMVFVDRPGKPSLICDGDDRSRDFARVFGLALSRRPGPRGAFCQSHLSRDCRGANHYESGLDLPLPIRKSGVSTSTHHFGLRHRKRATRIGAAALIGTLAATLICGA